MHPELLYAFADSRRRAAEDDARRWRSRHGDPSFDETVDVAKEVRDEHRQVLQRHAA